MAEQAESIEDNKKRRKGKIKNRLKLILIIVIAVMAFIIIITAAWKQQLLDVTSGGSNFSGTMGT